MSKTKYGFSARWKRRKNYKVWVYKFNVWIALYLGIYKIRFTADSIWELSTYSLFTKRINNVAMYFKTGTLAENKLQFKNALQEYLHKTEDINDRTILVDSVLKDLITECCGYTELITAISWLNNDEKIIEGLRKLRPEKLK